jgi:hypothetical protein
VELRAGERAEASAPGRTRTDNDPIPAFLRGIRPVTNFFLGASAARRPDEIRVHAGRPAG